MLTKSEKNYLLTSMQNLLEEYNYTYTIEALEKIIDTWAEAKSTLIEAFKKHPNYLDGKFMIAFDTNYERKVNIQESFNFRDFIYSYCAPAKLDFPEEVKAKTSPWMWIAEDINNIIFNIDKLAEQFISEENAAIINSAMPELHIHTGQKTSRVVNKMCCYLGFDKVDGYNKAFAKYADSLNPMIIKRHTVLSINPLDYLTMSFGNSWASCHTIDKNNKRDMPDSYSGCYSSGTISYMLDPSSMVLYTVDASYDGTEYWNQDKINRQMFHWGEEKLVQGRLYPQDNDYATDSYTKYRNIVQEIMSVIFDFPNLWNVKKGTGAASQYIYSYGTNYKDYYHYNNCSLSRIKGSENEQCFDVGSLPICIECGERHRDKECINHCNGSLRCSDCGCFLDEDDCAWVNGEPYCYDCVHYCEYCDEYHQSHSTYIPSEDIYVCETCLQWHYQWCDRCYEYHHEDNMTYIESEDRSVCDDCYSNYYDTCHHCGKSFNKDDMHEDDNGNMFCEECFKEHGYFESEEAC